MKKLLSLLMLVLLISIPAFSVNAMTLEEYATNDIEVEEVEMTSDSDLNNLSIGDTVFLDGIKYTVYEIDENGLVNMAENVNDVIQTDEANTLAATCTHPDVRVIREFTTRSSFTNNASSHCYTTTKSTENFCNRCGFKFISKYPSVKHSHNFPLIFGSQCKNEYGSSRCTAEK